MEFLELHKCGVYIQVQFLIHTGLIKYIDGKTWNDDRKVQDKV